jgi:NAD(P)-dependent dehydrogenase (short-subunit alcohol dehydrogenase family)
MKAADPRSAVALVTGATSGLGRAVAERLADEGYFVFGTGRNPGKREGDEKSPNGKLRLLALDVESQESVDSTLAQVVAEKGRLDLLVACAGMGVAGAVEDCPFEDIEAQMRVNFLGTVRTVRSCLPQLRRSKGRIIIVGSLAGRIGMPFQAF